MARINLNKLPGIAPVGFVDPLAAYFRERGVEDTEWLTAELRGPNAAALVATEGAALAERSKQARTRNSKGLMGFLHDARALATQVATTNGDQGAMYRGAWSLNHLPKTNFTEFMADALDISPRKLNRTIGRTGLRIFTHFEGSGSRAGHVSMSYDAHRSARAGYFAPILTVGLHDSYEFVNVNFARDDEAQGNIAAVPGALEALWEDAQLVAQHMIEDATGSSR